MLEQLSQFFQSLVGNNQEADTEVTLQLAAATLMCEVIRADDEIDGRELKALQAVLAQRFQLTPAQIDQLMALAQTRAEEAIDHYQFVKVVNDQCDNEEKVTLLESMWLMAYADGILDPEEELRIRRIADLLYVSHPDFIRAKQAAKQRLN